MRIGVTFPQTEIGADPGAVREYAQAAQSLGYAHVLAFDHVVGGDTAQRPDWRGPYTVHSLFHEPFVLFGYLAGIAPRLEFITGILILPQRQTVLVAKQAAEVDVLSNGKFRLGVGIGWNEVEYEALGERFGNRGKRSEEQIEVLRRLFSEEVVTYNGRWHTITAAGLNPMPVQRPIPIWIGGRSDATLRRVARVGDGWLPQGPPNEDMRSMLQTLRDYVHEAGRSPNDIGIEARVNIANSSPEEWARQAEGWRELGATHLAVNTMNAGLQGVGQHIDAIERFKEAIGDLLEDQPGS